MTKSKYNDSSSAIQVIGCILTQPSLLDFDGKYFFNEDDFINDFHKIIYGVIHNLHVTGTTSFTIKTIEDYLSNRPESYGIYKANKGAE